MNAQDVDYRLLIQCCRDGVKLEEVRLFRTQFVDNTTILICPHIDKKISM